MTEINDRKYTSRIKNVICSKELLFRFFHTWYSVSFSFQVVIYFLLSQDRWNCAVLCRIRQVYLIQPRTSRLIPA